MRAAGSPGPQPAMRFASTAAGNPLTAGDQWRNLELVAEVAREVWGG